MKLLFVMIFSGVLGAAGMCHAQLVFTNGGLTSQKLDGFNGGGEFVPGQTFDINLNAKLISIGLYLSVQSGVQAASFTFDLRSTAAGVPSSIIATASASNAALTTSSTLITADFSSQNIQLTSGTEYTIAVHPNTSVFIYGDSTNPYPNGLLYTYQSSSGQWMSSPGLDAGFAVTVTPEPSSTLSGLCGLGLLSLLRIRLPRRKTLGGGDRD